MIISRVFSLGFLMLALLSAGCAVYPVNQSLEQVDFEGRVDFTNMRAKEKREDEILFLVSFSGGGTRAAALSYGVLQALADTLISLNGEQSRLIDEIDLISSVSGGSFTAAYYGLFGDQIFNDFETLFLKRNIQGALIGQLLNPRNWFRLGSRKFGRSDLAAELYDKHLFKDLTFNDLRDRTDPVIMINATDATVGMEFSFHQNQFDWICSNLGHYPVSRAVAASSAVPGVLGAITLRNFSDRCGYEIPGWAHTALLKRVTHTPDFRQAARISSYLNAERRPFIHLLDGGLSDNLGVRAILDQITVAGGIVEGLRNIGGDQVRKIVVLIVNAETASEKELDLLERLPLSAQLGAASGVPINRYNYETVSILLKSLDTWRQKILKARCEPDQGSDTADSEPCAELDTYFIEVSFDALKDESEQQYLKELPTSFKLSDEDVDKLRHAAARIVVDSEEFQRLLRDLR